MVQERACVESQRVVECETCGGRGLHDCFECDGLGHNEEGDVCNECDGGSYVDCVDCNRTGEKVDE